MKKKRRFRSWPYLLAILVGAGIGVAVAMTAEWKGTTPPSPPGSTRRVPSR